jgi:hypothetical protein
LVSAAVRRPCCLCGTTDRHPSGTGDRSRRG